MVRPRQRLGFRGGLAVASEAIVAQTDVNSGFDARGSHVIITMSKLTGV